MVPGSDGVFADHRYSCICANMLTLGSSSEKPARFLTVARVSKIARWKNILCEP